jgi:hypothetical protein
MEAAARGRELIFNKDAWNGPWNPLFDVLWSEFAEISALDKHHPPYLVAFILLMTEIAADAIRECHSQA